MAILLLTALALIGLASALVMRSFSLGRARQRETMQQIGAYGFRTAAPKTAPPRDLGVVSRTSASTIGPDGWPRSTTSQQRHLRRQLDAAGLYHMSVETFLGYRVFSIAAPAVLISLLAVAGGGLSARSIVLAVWLTASAGSPRSTS